MINDKKVLAVIPARAGSKGIPGKNIIDLGGRPLIAYSIMAAHSSKYIDKVVVSTDGKEIADAAQRYGVEVPWLRCEALSGDRAKSVDVLLDAISHEPDGEYQIVVLLQPTQPFRTAEDVDAALELYVERNGSLDLVSVSAVEESPYLIRRMQGDGCLKPLLPESSTIRRQDMEQFYLVNGCVYVNDTARLTSNTSLNDNPLAYCMPCSRSIDIDTPQDLAEARRLLEER